MLEYLKGLKVIWDLKGLIFNIYNYVRPRGREIKNESLRKGFFWYRGVTSIDKPERIFPELEYKEGVLREEDAIAFAALNNRFSIFKPSSVNQRHLKPQVVRTKPDRNYEIILSKFHENYIVPFQYDFRGQGVEDPKPDFFQFLRLDKNILWVLGEIGCGKSTFVSHLCHQAKKSILKSNKNDVAVITINFNKKNFDFTDIDEAIFQLFSDAFKEQFKDVGKIQNLETLNQIVKKYFSEYKLNIIIDNLDELYDESAKLILKTEHNFSEFDSFYSEQNYQHVVLRLFELLYEFHQSYKETKVKFIICLREETYDVLSLLYQKMTGSEMGRHFDNRGIIQMSSPSNQFVSDTISNRFEMYTEPVNEEFKKFLIKFSQKAVKLKINGLRHVMESARGLLYLKNQSHLFYPNWMIDIYVYVDGYQNYAQRDCGVSNIFLINIDYRKDVDETHKKWPESSKRDHFHSYWLKYFIVVFLCNRNTVNSRHVRKVFDSYEPEIVIFSLYSLSEVNHGKLVACEGVEDPDGGGIVNNVSATKRLKYCIDKNMFFEFNYLSVIVEDDYLEFPEFSNKKLNDRLKKIFKPKLKHQEFFVKSNSWNEWLKISSKKVLVFFEVLKSSYVNFEAGLLGDEEGLFSPDFNQLEHDLVSSIEEIGNSLGLSESQILDVLKEAKAEMRCFKGPLKKHFSEYARAAVKYKNELKRQ